MKTEVKQENKPASRGRYPVTERALNVRRVQPVDHPWRRGFPNNAALKAALAEKNREHRTTNIER